MKILERSPVPVFTMALRGLRGSFLSRDKGNFFGRSFRREPFSKLELVVGEPLQPSEVTPLVLQEKVKALRGDWK